MVCRREPSVGVRADRAATSAGAEAEAASLTIRAIGRKELFHRASERSQRHLHFMKRLERRPHQQR